jgi:hypothetical protein
MSFNLRALVAGVAVAASLAVVSPASAKVVIYYFAGGASDGAAPKPHDDVFGPLDLIGGLPVKALNETKSACGVVNGCTYDYEFKLAGIVPGDTTSIQIQAQAQAKAGGGAQVISYDVFKGAPCAAACVANVSNPKFLGASTVSTNASLMLDLGNGSYFVQIAAPQVVLSGEVGSGSLVENVVPEPMAWTLMLLGFGGVGAAVRRRTVRQAANVA